ncbi:MAG TPA: hypothetical protein VM674_01940 [Candidatus Acidoferrum sp.]|nr:hypothetical protein [Candidatus Acidoferrum sp.]
MEATIEWLYSFKQSLTDQKASSVDVTLHGARRAKVSALFDAVIFLTGSLRSRNRKKGTKSGHPDNRHI